MACIEDYALIGDCETAALVCRNGSIDWLCLPDFASGACFAALLGTPDNGRWLLAPAGPARTTRAYREGTLLLDTVHETPSGAVRVTDFMPARMHSVIRVVEGLRGEVPMHMELVLRFDYGALVPWVRKLPHGGHGITAIAGPDQVCITGSAPLRGQDFRTYADCVLHAGERGWFALRWAPSYQPLPEPWDEYTVTHALRETERGWRTWSARCTTTGPYREASLRSLLTLKALTFHESGGIAAAPTTSLPEQLGGVRNWDYRYCWLRDATFTLYALMMAGYHSEAAAWRQWLLRAVAGQPAQLQIMYGLTGERRLSEEELPWLPGYEGARPVRIGNGAARQKQLDVYGEVMDCLHQARSGGLTRADESWDFQRALVPYVASVWDQPDHGLWEVRGPPRHFVHSKVMCWVALDRAVRGVEEHHLPGPAAEWRRLRDHIHEDICRHGYDPTLNSFVQSYGSRELDASLLMLPLVGFLPPTDPRIAGTVAAIERGLLRDGFVQRYRTESQVDGLPGGEGAFLACTFWLADNYVLLGRREDAQRLFLRLLGLRNDVGLLSEEYDPRAGRLVGNFPQAFSHVGLINTARNLNTHGPAMHRAR